MSASRKYATLGGIRATAVWSSTLLGRAHLHYVVPRDPSAVIRVGVAGRLKHRRDLVLVNLFVSFFRGVVSSGGYAGVTDRRKLS